MLAIYFGLFLLRAVHVRAAEASEHGLESIMCRDTWGSCHAQYLMGNCEVDSVKQNCGRTCGVCMCKDSNKFCELWASQGKCTGYGPENVKIREQCKKSCGSCACQDYDSMCTTWMYQNKCGQDDVYQKCPKSCNQCQCGDNFYQSCMTDARAGKCLGSGTTENEQYMLKHCQKSCNQCGGNICVDNFAECTMWRDQGKCAVTIGHPDYYKIRLHCAKSCGFCGDESGPGPEPQPTPAPLGCMDSAIPSERATCARLSKIGACSVQKFRDMCPLSCKVHRCEFCGDTHRDCKVLAQMGHCVSNFYYMRDNCHFSCGFCAEVEEGCEDLEDECPYKASQGYCQTDPENMFKECPYSCNVCQCGDNLASCATWAAQGRCMSDPTTMLTHCAKSCKVCGTLCEDMAGMESQCPQNKLMGYCETKQREMIQKCAKTCGFCTNYNPNPGPDPGPDPGPGPTDFAVVVEPNKN